MEDLYGDKSFPHTRLCSTRSFVEVLNSERVRGVTGMVCGIIKMLYSLEKLLGKWYGCIYCVVGYL